MNFTLSINMDNDAFTDGNGMEVHRILKKLLAELPVDLSDEDGGKLFDINGNSVGTWKVEADQ